MSLFDVNIHNYTEKELEEIFNLSTPYGMIDLEENANKLKTNIKNNEEITSETKTKTLEFIDKGKETLEKNAQLSMMTIDLKQPTQSQAVTMVQPEHPATYFPPRLNPVVKHDKKYIINIDSRFRDNYYVSQPSDFHVVLPLKFDSVVSMELSAIEFPGSALFSVSKVLGNNFFWIEAGSEAAGDLERTRIELPDGNFTSTDAISQFNSFLQSLTTTTYLQYIRFAQNSTNGSGSSQLIVAVSETFPFADPFIFTIDLEADTNGNTDSSTPLPLKLGWALGFRNGNYTANSSYIAEGIINLAGKRYFYLVVDDYNNYHNMFYSAFNASLLNKNILARIAVQNSNSAAVTFSNIGIVKTPRQYYGSVDIERMHIQLLDEYGRILNLNNMDFSFVLSFATGSQTPTWTNADDPAK